MPFAKVKYQNLMIIWSIRMAGWLALPTLDHGVVDLNPAGGEIIPESEWHFIAQSLSWSPLHHLEMIEILLKGCKNITRPSNDHSVH